MQIVWRALGNDFRTVVLSQESYHPVSGIVAPADNSASKTRREIEILTA